jgi:hypothetical protein
MASAVEELTIWIQGLSSLRLACIQINASASHLTLNAFAKAIISSQLTSAASVANFPRIANNQFATTGPQGWRITLALNTALSFAELNESLGGSFSLVVEDFLQSFCDPSCTVRNVLDLTKTLQDAFPGAVNDSNWLKMQIAIKTTNLDECISKASAAQELALIQSPGTNDLAALLKVLTAF